MIKSVFSIYFIFVVLTVLERDSKAHLVNREAKQSDAECQFSTESSILRCDNGQIECNATRNFTGEGTENYTNFAISLVPNQEKVEFPELVKFYLFPRIDENYHQNFTIQIGFMFHRFSIYYSQSMFDDGFRVTDLKCYSKLVKYFRSIKTQKTIQVKTDLFGVQNATVFGSLSV